MTNLSGNDPSLELKVLAPLYQSTPGLTSIPNAFEVDITQGPLKVNGKSTYMNVLKALVTLSEKDFLANYAGNTFSFEGYTDMRIQIVRTNSRSAVLQHRFAIYGLYSGIYHISKQSEWRETILTLYWSGSGSKTTVGYIKFLPYLPPGIGGSNETLSLPFPGQESGGSSPSPDLTNLTLISEDPDISASPNAPQLTISPVFGGVVMSLTEVFLTVFSALVVIAEPPSSKIVIPFSSSESHINARLEFKNPNPPRPWYPFFTYETAARSLGLLPKFMFQQGKFQNVAFVIKVDKTTVGGGFLGKRSTPSSQLEEMQTS
jgi:hypothetical protein